MKKIFTLIAGVIISINFVLAAAPTITFTTSQAVGSVITFFLTPSTANTTVNIDFGTGSSQPKTLPAQIGISGTVGASQTITITGAGISELNCNSASITSINVSNYPTLASLDCYTNQITALDVTKNTALTHLNFSGNQVTSMDVTKNTLLQYLACDFNKISSLDLSQNTKLTTLSCIWMGLNSLDVTHNTLLINFDCRLNNLTSLDVTHCPDLNHQYCFNNKIPSLNLSNNTKITSLNCSQNKLTAIDLTPLTKLNDVDIQYNQISSVDLSQCTVLKTIFCQNNIISAIDCSHNPLLETIYCNYNQIQKCTAATWIEFGNNKLATLDVTNNTLLQTLAFDHNSISSIDLSQNTKLEILKGNSNRLLTIDVSKNTLLDNLSLNVNNLTKIDLSKNTNLTSVSLSGNYFKFSTLPLLISNWSSYTYSPQNDMTIAKLIYVNDILDLSSEQNINGNVTTYEFMTSTNTTLVEGTDYVNNNGKIKFLVAQIDSVHGQLVNASFPNFISGISTVNTSIENLVSTGIDPMLSSNDITIYTYQDQVVVKTSSPMQVTIYTTSGDLVNAWQSNDSETAKRLTVPGVYIVKASDNSHEITQKVIVE